MSKATKLPKLLPERHLITVKQLRKLLKQIEDQTAIVVDDAGNPITGYSAYSDPDFGTAISLRSTAHVRHTYQVEVVRLKAKKSAKA